MRHVWRKEEVCTRFGWGNLRERDHWENQELDGRIILRWILRKWEGVVETGWSWLRIGQGAGACENGDELSGSIKCGEILDYLQNQLASQEGLCSMEKVSK